MNKQLWIQGALYTLIAALTPAYSEVASDDPLTGRKILALSIACVVAGATALKAFMSTTYSDSGVSDIPPKPVVIEQPPEKPVPTMETDTKPSVLAVKTTRRIKP